MVFPKAKQHLQRPGGRESRQVLLFPKNTQKGSTYSAGTHPGLGRAELGGAVLGRPLFFKRQWEARFDKTGDRIRELGEGLFCLAEGGFLNKTETVTCGQRGKACPVSAPSSCAGSEGED